ncbi:hypothetical protein, partial [Blastomonas sp. UPD001]|uniref:hypothetical protein n=1 Tax=Blastomonas sp. UPD001 TaxID=2217673 RepID=UPI0013008E23
MLREDTVLGSYVLPFMMAKGRKSIHRIAKESLRYKKHHNLRPKEYFFLALYMDYIEDDIVQYLPNGLVYHFNIVMNGELRPNIVEDKSKTSSRLLRHQVHSVQEFMAFDPARGFVRTDGTVLGIMEASRSIETAGG